MTTTEPHIQQESEKLSLPTLTAMVVGSMVGAGVFLLPRRFGTETGVLGAIIAWTIAGTGMLMLAFVFQCLATRKPDLDAGIFAVLHPVRAGRRALLQGSPRTRPTCFPTRRGGAVRRDCPRRHGGCGVLGYWGD
jgi:hypothetical protein